MTVAGQHLVRHPRDQMVPGDAGPDRDLAAGPGLADGSTAHDDDHVAAVETLCVGEAR